MSRVAQNRWEYPRLHHASAAWSLFVALLCALLLFGVWLPGVQVADEGMAPVLRAGDVVLFDSLSKYAHQPARGDIYSLRKNGAVQLGRVVGLPGETVEIHTGNVYINGAYLSESAYVQYAPADMPPLELKAGEFFLLPDDRTHMTLQPEGMVAEASALIGRAALRVYPLERVALF